MRPTGGWRAAAGAAALALVAACGGGGDAPPAAAPSTSAAREVPPPAKAVPAALDFVAPALTGGEVRGADYAGRDVALWFWAPW